MKRNKKFISLALSMVLTISGVGCLYAKESDNSVEKLKSIKLLYKTILRKIYIVT